MADRRGRKPMIVRATAGAAAGLVVMGISGGLGQLLLGRVMFSALAGTVPASNPLIAANTPPQHLSMAMGALQSSVYLSNTLGPLFGGVLAAVVGYRGSFLITAALYIASALPVILLVRERFVPPPSSRPLVSSIRADFAFVLREKGIRWPIIASLFALIGANIATTVLSLLVKDMVGEADAEALAGIAFFALGLSSAVAALTIGRLVARFGYSGLLRTTVPATALIYLALWAAPNYAALLILLALLGIAQGIQVPALTALVAARAPRERAGAVFGVVSSINTVAFSGGPFLAGMLARGLGLRSVFPVCALFLALMMLLVGRATSPVAQPAPRSSLPVPDEP
jgi:DHA1 family multidrug resistance protein-like MFS transporter